MSRLLDRVAIVTGASKGIGSGIARQLAADGAKVVISYASSKDGADAILAEIETAGGTAIALRADVRQRADMETLVEAAREHFGRLDILVNNAGVYRFARIEDEMRITQSTNAPRCYVWTCQLLMLRRE